MAPHNTSTPVCQDAETQTEWRLNHIDRLLSSHNSMEQRALMAEVELILLYMQDKRVKLSFSSLYNICIAQDKF